MMEMQKVLEQRRSIRKYQDKPIKKEVVEELLHAALLAPTWKNSQTGRYYVVMDKDKLEQVKKEGLAPFNAENTKVAAALQDNIAQLERYTLILGAITLLLACLMMITAFFRKKILHKKDIA